MRVRNSQTFLSLYHEPGVVEIAVDDLHEDPLTETWGRNTKTLGQVETPPDVAALMARWVMFENPETVLDPAAGLGNLLNACHRQNPRAQLVGVERDVETFRRAKSKAPRGTKLILADYLFANAGLFDGIIANPPYVKAQRLDYTASDWHYFEERLGTRLDRLTNLYALFLLKIWEDLAPNGRAAVLVPAEFLNANFGEEIKERLLRALHPAGIIIFSPSLNVFANALTTSAVIFLQKGLVAPGPLHATKANTLEEASAFTNALLARSFEERTVTYTDLAQLSPRDKWLNALLNEAPPPNAVRFERRLGDYFSCRRGIATGSNEFFCLNASGLRDHALNLDHVEPCITKAADASGLVFSREKFASLAAADRRCYLLNPRHYGHELECYLRLGEQLNIPRRHLPSHRPVWYLPENRAVADIWVAVFSRENAKFILNNSGAKNLTCFHGLYAKPSCENLAPLLTLFLNSSGGREAFTRVNRFYGGGLNKLEPKDVEAMPCPKFPELTQADAENLTRQLVQMESLPEPIRCMEVDTLLARYLSK